MLEHLVRSLLEKRCACSRSCFSLVSPVKPPSFDFFRFVVTEISFQISKFWKKPVSRRFSVTKAMPCFKAL